MALEVISEVEDKLIDFIKVGTLPHYVHRALLCSMKLIVLESTLMGLKMAVEVLSEG